MSYVRVLNEPSARLTVVVNDKRFGVTDAEGRVTTLQLDGKKVEERVENGLLKISRKTRWEGPAVVTEIELDGGNKLERRYELSPGGTELHVTTKMSGGRGGTRTTLFLYERPPQ